VYRGWWKPCLDRLLAGTLLLVGWPVIATLFVLVRWRLGSPAIFRQVRPGQGGQCFTMYKFRTMTDERGPDGQLLPDDQRLTRFGAWLRKTSLDELPELWNILRGEMSFVGPRPLLVEYLPLYSPTQARRHEVKPGLTGWAQVNGRNAISWEQRFALDVWYVDHLTLGLDLQILWRTVAAVWQARGVAAPGEATMSRFRGSAGVVSETGEATGAVESSTSQTEASVELMQWPAEGAPLAAFMVERVNMSIDPQRPVVVIGAGGHAKVVISTLQSCGVRVDGVYDDDPRRWGESLLGVPIRGSTAMLKDRSQWQGVIAIGGNQIRERLASELPLRWITVVHPRACVHTSAQVGAGTVVFAGAVIQPDTVIGRHCVVNTGASVDHDNRIDDFAFIGPGARLAGGVTVGPGAMLGIGAVVIPGRTIGRQAIVGAGAVVIRDLPADIVAVGCPAEIVRTQVAIQRHAA
jgi:sugar O-acyltransferase (sialic acid O-acetyltransferase NeuD family)